MTADIDAVLSRLRERPECRDAVEAIEELAGVSTTGPRTRIDRLLVEAHSEIERLTAEVERLREAIRWHRLAAEETVGADTTDPEYYEPFDHALWAALRESTPEVPSDG